jgi:DNA-binding GntR family transcriptional regulator
VSPPADAALLVMEPEGEMDIAKEKLAVAKELLAAIKSGDAEAASMALEDHYDLCKEADMEEAPEAGEEDEGY